VHGVLLSPCCPAHVLQESTENIHPLAAVLALQVLLRKRIYKETGTVAPWKNDVDAACLSST